MPSVLYPRFKQALLNADLDVMADNLRVVLVDVADYVYSDAHDFLDDVPAAARVATSPIMTGKSAAGPAGTTPGVFDAADVTFTGVTGDPSEALIIYRDTGTAATSNLICYIDTVAGPAALTVTPNTGDIVVTWSAQGIFTL
jgi:hypothetical protein